MMQDKIIIGGLVGLIGKVALDICQVPLWRLKLIKHPLGHYAASLIIDVKTIHHTLFGTVVSLVTDYIYGIFLGIVFVYFIQLTGKRHIIWKGLIYGAFIWLFSFGGLRALPIVKLREVVPDQALYYLLIHLAFGFGLGVAAQILTQRKLVEL